MTPALGPGRSVLLPANPTMLGFLTIPPFLPLLLGQLVPSAILNYSMDYWVPYTQTRPFKSAFWIISAPGSGESSFSAPFLKGIATFLFVPCVFLAVAATAGAGGDVWLLKQRLVRAKGQFVAMWHEPALTCCAKAHVKAIKAFILAWKSPSVFRQMCELCSSPLLHELIEWWPAKLCKLRSVTF